MVKFQSKYRVETARAKWWNYDNPGDYFITICTKNRDPLFGYIKDGEMILNEYGQIILDCWLDLPNHYDNIILGEFQIMPNHIHCIVGVNDSKIIIPDSDDVETGLKPVCTEPVCTAGNMADNFVIENPNKKNHGVFEFIRALKSFSSRKINERRNSRGVSNWQERFHDHIIRNEAEYDRIRNYIINNPKKWDEDCFYT
ncbi:transposase [Flavobacterium hydrophilum]|uniref:Transposase n=1 Tax=Flavobacterium hydrophilum TaxID=2211445 RepID=A0A2V4C3D9_9FLAO|nr:transposase [Flavobacterium hydrophilum]PXY44613.1 transposase [Flavobacterium hydrophilum]